MGTIPLLSEAFSDARLNLDSLDKDIKAATAKVRKAAEQMEQALKLTVDIDTSGAERKLDQLATTASRVKARIEADAAELRVDVDLDAERAAVIGREARQALEAGFGDRPLDLDVDLDYESATFYGRVARLSIEEGFGDRPLVADVTADFDAALFAGRVARDSLEAGVGVTPVQVEVDVDLGSLATARAEIEAITRFDEDVRLDLNTTKFDAKYAKVIAKLEALTGRDWNVEIDTNALAVVDVIEEVIAAAREADRLKVGVTFDTDGADAARQAAREARERFEADPPTIRPDVDLPDTITPEVDVDTSKVDRAVDDVRDALFSVDAVARNLDTTIDYELRLSADSLNDQVIRRAAQRAADTAARVQASVNQSAAAKSARENAEAARKEADDRFQQALRVERRIAAEVLKARRATRRRGLDLAARDNLKEAKQALDAAQEQTRIARQAAADRLAEFRDADLELVRTRRRFGATDNRVERFSVQVEGVAAALANFALVKRAKAGLDRTETRFVVDTDGIAEAVELTERFRGRAAALFDTIGDRAADAGRRAREAFRDRDFEFSVAGFRREFDAIASGAADAASKVRASLRRAGQTGIDLAPIRDGFSGLWRTVTRDADRALGSVRVAAQRAVDAFRGGTTIRARVTGVAGVLADLAKIVAAKAVAATDINIDVDVRGGLSRGLTRIGSAIAGVVASGVQGFARLASVAGRALGGIGGVISDGLAQASGALSDFVSNASKQLQSLASQFSAASGPMSTVASVVGTAALPSAIIAAITVLVGPIISAVGGLIGAAIAFLTSSAIAGVAAAGLPIAAILFDDKAKQALIEQVKPLKDLIVNEFAGTTDLIVNEIAPAFVALGQKVIPLAARVSESFIRPIADAVVNLADSLLPVIEQVTGPMAEGIASVLDTVAQFGPLFGNITLAVGPGLTNAFNAILEVSLRIAAIFAGDIGQGFQEIANLLERIQPALVSAGDAVLPLVRFLGGLIELFVNAGAQFESVYQPLGDSLDQLTARLPELVPLLAGIAVTVVSIIDAFTAMIPVIAFLNRGVQLFVGLLQLALAGLLKFVGGFTKLVANAFDLLVSGIAGVLEIISNIPFLPDSWQQGLAAASDATQRFGDRVSATASEADDWGDSLYNGGVALFELAVGADGAAASVDAARERIAALDSDLRTGKIGFVEYADAVAGVGSGLNPLLGFIDQLRGKLKEGEFAISSFVDTVARELPTAADFVEDIEIKDPTLQFRENRDRQRAMQDLERQAVRDADQINRNAEDYQRAIADAAKVRAEAPKQYTFGANNFNAALFADSVKRQEEFDRRVADAERNVQDRARALEDARIAARDSQTALEDARYDAAFGEPESIKVKTIDIVAALQQAGQQIADAQQKALTLIQIRALGRDFDPLADFLEGLDPAQFVQAIDQLGPVGSEAFASVAAQWNEAVDKGNTTFEEALAKTRNIIAEETLRINRLSALQAAGANDLVEQLVGIESAEEFNNIYDGIEKSIGLEAAERAAEGVAGERAALDQLAFDTGFNATKNYLEAQQRGVTAAQEEAAKKFGELGLGAFPIFGQGGAAAGGPAPEFPEVDAALAAARTVIEGQAAELSGQLSEAVTSAAANLPSPPFFDGGKIAAGAFTLGFDTGLVERPLLAQFDTSTFGPIGDASGRQFAGGFGAGLNAAIETLDLAGFIAVGTRAAGAVTEGFRGAIVGQTGGVAGIGAPVLAAGGISGAVSGQAGLIAQQAAEGFAAAGATLGGALIVGVIAALNVQAVGVNTALAVLAAAVLAAAVLQAWAATGQRLAEELIRAVADTLTGASTLIALAVATLISSVNADSFATEGNDIGAAIVAGIVAGLTLGSVAVADAARATARAAAEAARQELGINSPSRVFMGIGANTAEGFAIGLESKFTQLGIGSGVGAMLTGQVTASANQAVYNQQSAVTETNDNRVAETNIWNVYAGGDSYETAAEIAMRQRTRRYVNQGRRRR